MTRFAFTTAAMSLLLGCQERNLDARELGAAGDVCEPSDLGEEAPCEAGLSCDPTTEGDSWTCVQQITLRGRVFDALSQMPIAEARVTALDESGSPVSTGVRIDADGHYALTVRGRRDAAGAPAKDVRWTIFATASGYQAFPSGIRPAIPVAGSEAVASDEGYAVSTTAAHIGMIPLADAQQTSTVAGTIEATTPAGTMVVAQSDAGEAIYTIADVDGRFILFNVPRGSVTLRGYRRGLELESLTLDVREAEHQDVVLDEVTSDLSALARVSGNLSIVNAPGDSKTSVVLVPAVLWSDALERGPVPFGLRAPEPPGLPSVTGQFEIDGVPSGTYKVLAAFENDALVRDPDASISGTDIVEIEVATGQSLELDTGFKITEALAIVGPGADSPETVESAPTFEWADDSSETRYELLVHDALGEVVWEKTDIPGVSGSATVELPYDGEALTPGMTYQFRVTSYKDTASGTTALSRSEDLRGIFTFMTDDT